MTLSRLPSQSRLHVPVTVSLWSESPFVLMVVFSSTVYFTTYNVPIGHIISGRKQAVKFWEVFVDLQGNTG